LRTKPLKAHRGSGGSVPSILIIDIGGSFTPRPLYPRGNLPTKRQKSRRARTFWKSRTIQYVAWSLVHRATQSAYRTQNIMYCLQPFSLPLRLLHAANSCDKLHTAARSGSRNVKRRVLQDDQKEVNRITACSLYINRTNICLFMSGWCIEDKNKGNGGTVLAVMGKICRELHSPLTSALDAGPSHLTPGNNNCAY